MNCANCQGIGSTLERVACPECQELRYDEHEFVTETVAQLHRGLSEQALDSGDCHRVECALISLLTHLRKRMKELGLTPADTERLYRMLDE